MTGVFVVDDSAVVRQVLSAVLADATDVEVVGTASDPLFALDKMQRRWPDVIILDVEMPRMDGVTFLRRIMAERPTPVIICSSLTERGAQVTVDAMGAGAVEVITKPRSGLRDFLQHQAPRLIHAVRAAANARLANVPSPTAAVPARVPTAPASLGRTTDQVVALGTSTGGTKALELVLTALPADCPAIAVVQHMPEKFTTAFAQRMNGLCPFEVREAQSGDRLVEGRVLLAPGGRHMRVCRSGGQYQVEISDAPPVNRHRPSVDVLFRSVAKSAGRNSLGIIMTGMGDDGARGLLAMRQAGARTIAQDEATCVVYGMPKEAVRLGAAERVLRLDQIPALIAGVSRRDIA